jgi:SAM-dependent methyltransferase
MDLNLTADSMHKAYTAGPLFETWRAKQDMDLWPSELAMVRTHCQNPDALVANVGCGAGRETFALHRMGYRNLCGIGRSEALLDAARRRCSEQGLRIRFEVASAEQLPFAAESVDAITMFENICGHITPHSARLRSVAKAARVLKPGGKILLTVTSLHHSLLYMLYFQALELGRHLFNPRGMERGDKLLRRSVWPAGSSRRAAPRTHWFRPGEISSDASRVGLVVIQKTTTHALVLNAAADSLEYRGGGRLAFVLGRPDLALPQAGLP